MAESKEKHYEILDAWLSRWPLRDRCPRHVEDSISRWIDVLEEGDTELILSHMSKLNLGSEYACACGCREDCQWVHRHHAAYGWIIWELLRRSGQMNRVRDLIEERLAVQCGLGGSGPIRSKEIRFSRLLLLNFFGCRPTPSWVEPQTLSR